MKTSYVQINGKLYEKTGDNAVIIAGEIHYRIAGRWTPVGEIRQAPMVMPDIDPYRSVIDGREITSRSRHREHLRDHGCIEVGNEPPRPKEIDLSAARGLREELQARLNP